MFVNGVVENLTCDVAYAVILSKEFDITKIVNESQQQNDTEDTYRKSE